MAAIATVTATPIASSSSSSLPSSAPSVVSGRSISQRVQLGDGDLCVGYTLPLPLSHHTLVSHQSSSLVTIQPNRLYSFGGTCHDITSAPSPSSSTPSPTSVGIMHQIIPFDTPDITGVAWLDASVDDTDKLLEGPSSSPRVSATAAIPTPSPAKTVAQKKTWTCGYCTMMNQHTIIDESTLCQTCNQPMTPDMIASLNASSSAAAATAAGTSDMRGARIIRGRLPGPLTGVAAVTWNNDIYICGGIDTSRQLCSWRVWRYTCNSGQWSMVYPNPSTITPAIASSPLPPSDTAPCRAFMQATVLFDAIYCFGGVAANGDVVSEPTVHRFCLKTHTWTIVSVTPSVAATPTASTAPSPVVDGTLPLSISSMTRSFSSHPGSLPLSVWGGSLSSQDESLWLFGGSNHRNGAVGATDQWWQLRLNDSNNGTTGEWIPHNQLRGRPSPRFFPASSCSSNCLYIHGGSVITGGIHDGINHGDTANATTTSMDVLADIHRFDFLREQWSRVLLVKGQSPGDRWGHAMTWYRNRLYLTGGRDKTGVIVPGVNVLAIRTQMLPYKRDDVNEREKDWLVAPSANHDDITAPSSSQSSANISGGIWTRLLMGITSRHGNVQSSSAPASTAGIGLLKYAAHGSGGAMVTVGDRMYICGGQATNNGCTSLISYTCPPSNVIDTSNNNGGVSKNHHRIPFPINAAVTSLRPHAPLPFPLHGVAIIAYHGALYVWGGKHGVTHQCSDLLLKYDIKSDEWAVLRTRGASPPALAYSSVCMYHDDFMMVFGGEDDNGRCTSRVWLYSFHQQRWWHIPTYGQSIAGRHSAIIAVGAPSTDDSNHNSSNNNSNKRSIWIHGGVTASGAVNTTHELRLEFDVIGSKQQHDILPAAPSLTRQISTNSELLAVRAGLPFFATHTTLRHGLQVALSGDWEGKQESVVTATTSEKKSSPFEWHDLSDGKNHATRCDNLPVPMFTTVRYKDHFTSATNSVTVKRLARSPPSSSPTHIAASAGISSEVKGDEKRSSLLSSSILTATATPLTTTTGATPADDSDDIDERRADIWKTVRVVRFTGDSGVSFPDSLILPMPYTVIIVDRYTDDAKVRGRTLQSRDTNWLIGRSNGHMGHYAGNGWVPSMDHDPTIPASSMGSFNISTATMDHNGTAHWYIDGVHRGSAANRHPPGTLAVGRAGWKHDGSDADVATVLVWSRVLDHYERVIVEYGLAEKYGVFIADGHEAYRDAIATASLKPSLTSSTSLTSSSSAAIIPARSKRQSSVIITERDVDGSLVTTVTTTTRESPSIYDARAWRVRGQWATHEAVGHVPSPRRLTGGVGWTTSLAVWGGQTVDNNAVNDGHLYIYSYATKSWSCISLSGSTTPVARRGHAIAYDPHHNGRLFIYGGQDAAGRYQQELYVCDLHTHTDQDDIGQCMEYNEVQPGSKLYVLVAKIESRDRLNVWICNHGDRAAAIRLTWTTLQSCELMESCNDELVLPPGACELYAIIKIPNRRSSTGWRYAYDTSCHWDQSRLPCHSWFRLQPSNQPQRQDIIVAHTTFPIAGGFLAGRRKVLLHGIILTGERFILELKRDHGSYTYVKMESRPTTQQVSFNSASPAWLDEVLIPPYASERKTTPVAAPTPAPAKAASRPAAKTTVAAKRSGEVKESKDTVVTFPFVAGQQFWLEITANDVQFTFTVRTGSGTGAGATWSASYMHRLPYPGINQLTLAGDVYVIKLDKIDATYVCPRGEDCNTCTIDEQKAALAARRAAASGQKTAIPSVIRTASVVHRGLATAGKFVAPKIEKPSSVFESLRDAMDHERHVLVYDDIVALTTLLEEGNGRAAKYLSIIEKCLARGEPFCDPFFPPNAKSLGDGTPASKVSSWKRPREYNGDIKPIMVSLRTDPCDVIQGDLGDCWFLSSLSLVASRPHVFSQLIIPTGLAHIGLYAVRFYKNGAWRTVVVDDRIPCGYQGQPVFGRNDNKQEIWVAIIEKAYAKLHGSYMAIDGMYGGKAEDALVDLTGGIPEHFSFHDHSGDIASGRLYNKLLEYHLSGHLLCGAMVPSTSANELRGKRVDALGIEDTHAYSILSVRIVQGTPLIQLRNPYGHISGKWKGAWSDWCELWSASLLTDVGYRKGVNNGIFWMSYFDFVARFNVLHIVRTGLSVTPQMSQSTMDATAIASLARPLSVRRVSLRRNTDVSELWQSFSFRGQWSLQKRNAGGSAKFGRWRENVQYTISVDQPSTKVIIVLTQEDVRMNLNSTAGTSDNNNSGAIHKTFNDIGFVVMRTKYADRRFVRPVNKVSKYLQYQSTFSGSRAVSALLRLPHGIYALIPSTFTPLGSGQLNYVLDVFVMSRSSSGVTSVTPVMTTSTGGGGALPSMPRAVSTNTSVHGAGPVPLPSSPSSTTSATVAPASAIASLSSMALPPQKPQFYRETSKGVLSTVDAKSAIVRRVVPVNDWQSAYVIAERPKEKIIWVKRRKDDPSGGCSGLTASSSNRKMYECYTCDQTQGKLICGVCSKRCHDGHIMMETQSNKTCDCGTHKISGFHCVSVRARSHWRCLNPTCGEINIPGRTACFECDQTAKEEVEEQMSEKKDQILFRNVYRLTLTPRIAPSTAIEAAASFTAASAAQVQAIADSAIAAGLEVPPAVLPALTRQLSDNRTTVVLADAPASLPSELTDTKEEKKVDDSAAAAAAADWTCTFCQYTNPSTDLVCDFCNHPKPTAATTATIAPTTPPVAASIITVTPPPTSITAAAGKSDEELPTAPLLMVTTASGLHNTRPVTLSGSPAITTSRLPLNHTPISVTSTVSSSSSSPPATVAAKKGVMRTPHAFVVMQAVQPTQSQLSTRPVEDPHLALSVFMDHGTDSELKLTEADRIGYTGFNRTQEIFLTLPPKGGRNATQSTSTATNGNGSVSFIIVPWIKGHGFSITTFSDCDCKLTKLNTIADIISPAGPAIDADIDRYGLHTDGKTPVPPTGSMMNPSGSVPFGPNGPVVPPPKVIPVTPTTPVKVAPPPKPTPKPGDTGTSEMHTHPLTLAIGLRNRNCDCCPKNPIAIAWQCTACGWDECPDCFERNDVMKHVVAPPVVVTPPSPVVTPTPTPTSPTVTPVVPSVDPPVGTPTPTPTEEKKTPVVEAQPVPQNWTCPACTYANDLKQSVCVLCNTSRYGPHNPNPGGSHSDASPIAPTPSPTTPPITRPPSVGPNQWACPACTTHNPLRVVKCSTCGGKKPAVVGPSPKRVPVTRADHNVSSIQQMASWKCATCTVTNAWHVDPCKVCATVRPQPWLRTTTATATATPSPDTPVNLAMALLPTVSSTPISTATATPVVPGPVPPIVTEVKHAPTPTPSVPVPVVTISPTEMAKAIAIGDARSAALGDAENIIDASSSLSSPLAVPPVIPTSTASIVTPTPTPTVIDAGVVSEPSTASSVDTRATASSSSVTAGSSSSAVPSITRQATLDREAEVMTSLARHIASSSHGGDADGDGEHKSSFDSSSATAAAIIAAMAASYTSTSAAITPISVTVPSLVSSSSSSSVATADVSSSSAFVSSMNTVAIGITPPGPVPVPATAPAPVADTTSSVASSSASSSSSPVSSSASSASPSTSSATTSTTVTPSPSLAPVTVPTPTPAPAPATTYDCEACTFVNPITVATCGICGANRPRSVVVPTLVNVTNGTTPNLTTSNDDSKDQWSCPQCTMMNANTVNKCTVCDATKPGSFTNGTTSGSNWWSSSSNSNNHVGDATPWWECPSCEKIYGVNDTAACHGYRANTLGVKKHATTITDRYHPCVLTWTPLIRASCSCCQRVFVGKTFRCVAHDWDVCIHCHRRHKQEAPDAAPVPTPTSPPPAKTGAAPTPATWKCGVCDAVNQGDDNVIACSTCTSLRPNFIRGLSVGPTIPTTPTPPTTTTTSANGNASAAAVAVAPPSSWLCSVCTNPNEGDWLYCTLCGSQKTETNTPTPLPAATATAAASAQSSSMSSSSSSVAVVPSVMAAITPNEVKTSTPVDITTTNGTSVTPTTITPAAAATAVAPVSPPPLVTSTSIVATSVVTAAPQPASSPVAASVTPAAAVASPSSSSSSSSAMSGSVSSLASPTSSSSVSFDVKTVCDVWEKAMIANDNHTATLARGYISRHAEQVVHTDAFNALRRVSIRELLTWPELEVNEAVLFTAVTEWAESDLARHHGKWPSLVEKRDGLVDIIPLLHLPSLSVAEITSIIQPSGLIDGDVIMHLLEYAGGHDETKRSIAATHLSSFPIMPRGTTVLLHAPFTIDTPTVDDRTRVYPLWSFTDAPTSLVTNQRLCATPPSSASDVNDDKLQTIQLPYTADIRVSNSSGNGNGHNDWKHLLVEWCMGGNGEPLMAGLQLATYTISFNTNGTVVVDGPAGEEALPSMPFVLAANGMHQFRLTITRTSSSDSKEFEGMASLHVAAAATSDTGGDSSSAVNEWNASFHFLAPLVNHDGIIAANQLVLVSSLAPSRHAYFSGVRVTKTR